MSKDEEPLLTSFSVVLSPAQGAQLKEYLSARAFLFRSVDYAHFGASSKGDKVSMTFYKSGKLFIQGKGTGEFVRFYLEPELLKQVSLGYEEELNEKGNVDRIGVDESGKGDYFGPLVIAGVFVAKGEGQALRNMGVRDSKNITDKMITVLAAKIKKTQKFSVVAIGPEKYNQLYSGFKNLNRLLAWGHARVIENMLEIVKSPKAISDQFGNKKLIENALMKKGKEIELVQMHRAESDIAVAAASILARAEFLRGLQVLEEKFKVELCKGASTKTKELALKIAKEKGWDTLKKCCKLHFKTTEWVQSKVPNKQLDLPNPVLDEEDDDDLDMGSAEKKTPDSISASS